MTQSMAQGTALATDPGHGRISFVVIGQGPHKPEEERQLERALRRDPAVRSADFLIHLGGMMQHAGEPAGKVYSKMAQWLQTHSAPALLLPGHTEWQTERAENLDAWRNRFIGPIESIDDSEPEEATGLRLSEIQRQNGHPENFAFSKANVLFLGIDLPGGETGLDEEVCASQTRHATDWVRSQLGAQAENYRAAVVFAHAFPSFRHEIFSDALRETARTFDRPILYLHTASLYFPDDVPHHEGPPHTRATPRPAFYHRDRPWPDLNVLRVQTDPLGAAPPLKISIMGDPDRKGDLFVFDRQYFRGPYLTFSTPESINIAWRTSGPTSPVVRVGMEPGEWEQVLQGESIRCRTAEARDEALRLHSAPPGACQYDVTVCGLAPSTKYYYQIADGETVLAGGGSRHYFQTHPPTGQRAPVRVWAFGDSGRGNQPQADVHRAMRRFTADPDRPIDLFLHCGDMAYTRGTDEEFQRHFFRPYESTLRHTPFWPTMSNHEGHTSSGQTDTGPYYDAFVLPTRGEAGGVPSHTQSFFGFDYGNVHFICLCSYSIDLGPDGAQGRWLRENLAHVRKRGVTDWVVAYFHHPPYTKGSHDSDLEPGLIQVREYVMPLLEEGGVDVILAGHSHTYERSMLINGAYGTPTVAAGHVLDDGDGDPDGDGPYRKSPGLQPHQGCVTVVCGCGGTAMSRRGVSPLMKTVLVENGAVFLDVEGEKLTGLMLNARGEIRDRFVIVKDQPVALKPVASPSQLPPYTSYPRLPTLLTLPTPPSAEWTDARLHIAPLSEELAITVEWEVSGTNWKPESDCTTVNLHADQPCEQILPIKCEGEPFPLPQVNLIFRDPRQGDVSKSVHLNVPAWRAIELRPLPQAPVIDGVPDTELLQTLDGQERFIDFRGTGYEEVSTRFHAGLWEGRLYVAVDCPEPEMHRLHISDPNAEEAHGSDDGVEIFLQRGGEGDLYHFALNSAGQRMDARNGLKPVNRAWSGDWESAVHHGKNGWSVEFLIHLGMLGDALRAGEELRLNVARNHTVRRQYTEWSYTNRDPHASPFYGLAKVTGE